MMIMMVLVVLSRIRKCHWIVPFPLESQWEQLVAINARKRWMPATDTRHETICDDDENMSKFRIIPQNSSTDSRLCGTIFLQFHFANGSSSLLLEYLKSFPDENFTAGNLHFNAFDVEKLSWLSFSLTKTIWQTDPIFNFHLQNYCVHQCCLCIFSLDDVHTGHYTCKTLTHLC